LTTAIPTRAVCFDLNAGQALPSPDAPQAPIISNPGAHCGGAMCVAGLVALIHTASELLSRTVGLRSPAASRVPSERDQQVSAE